MSILVENINPHIPSISDVFDIRVKLIGFCISDWYDYVTAKGLNYKRDSGLSIKKIRDKETKLFKDTIISESTNIYYNAQDINSSAGYIIASIRYILCLAWDLPIYDIDAKVTYRVDANLTTHLHSFKFIPILPPGANRMRTVELILTPKPHEHTK